MEKYYTPEFSEYHVGFEFEMDDTWGGWKKLVLSEDMLKNPMVPLGSGNERSPYYHKARVKYLDRSDIESCGFILFNEEDAFEKRIPNYRGRKDLKCHIVLRKTLLIIIGDNDTPWSDWSVIFTGLIKNKSELKVLLKQLGI